MDFKRKKTSEIWSFFEPINKDTAVCNLCKSKFSLRGSTSNLRKHIQRKHPTVNLSYVSNDTVTVVNETLNQPSTSKQIINNDTPVIIIEPESTIPSSLNFDSTTETVNDTLNSDTLVNVSTPSNRPNISIQNRGGKRQTTMSSYVPKKVTVVEKNKIDNAILKLISWDFQPFTVVEDKGFKNLMQVCVPLYKIPSRKYFSNTLLPALFEEKRGILKHQLEQDALSVCLTTDSWTSPVNDSYTAVTVHYIDENFVMKSYLLECAEANESHTSQYLAAEIRRVVEEWGLSQKVSIIITDNAANITSAVEKVLKLKHFGCYAHKINLVVQDALVVLETLIKKIKAIVTFFKRSNAAVQKLIKYQQQTGVKQPKKLLQDVVTRWNSTYYMFERFVCLQDAIRHTLALTDSDLELLSTDDWEACKQACYVLEPFEQVTKVMSAQNYVSASKVIPITRGLKSTIHKVVPDITNNHVKILVEKLLGGINKRFPNLEVSKTFSLCSFLDPHYKQHMFEEKSTIDIIKKHTTELVTGLINKKNMAIEAEEDEEVEEVSKKNGSDGRKYSIWDDVDETISQARPVGTPYSQAIQEVQRYFDDKPIPRKENPLLWWKAHEKIYPNLAHLVRTHLNMVATSVPCERMFSKAGSIITERRTRLQTKKVKELMFLNANVDL